MTSIRHSNWFAALGAAALVALSATLASAGPAYVKSTVNLRAGPDTTTEILGKIPGGSLVDAENCENNWCAVNWQGKSGFAIMTALDTSGRVPAPQRAARPQGPRAPVARVTVEDDDDEIEVGGPAYYGAPVYYGYRPYYRPYGYYRFGGYYGHRGGYRRRW
jgi:uncharacterized protein YraI